MDKRDSEGKFFALFCLFQFNSHSENLFQVTKLERDPASGTSLQEMNFWLNLERALQKIVQKRESDEVLILNSFFWNIG